MNNCQQDSCEYEENGKCTFCESGYQCIILKELGESITLKDDGESLFYIAK